MSAQQAQAYKDATDNLIYLKREQFQITYYTWLLLAALYILSKQVRPDEKATIAAGIFVVGVASIATLWTFQSAINQFRRRLNYIYQTYFDEADRGGMGLSAKEAHYGVVAMLTAVCLIASVFTLKAIY